MSSSLESAIVLPFSFVCLLSFATLVFPAYEGLSKQIYDESAGQRQAAQGQAIYRVFYTEAKLPQLESHVDSYKDLLSLFEDNLSLLQSASEDLIDFKGNDLISGAEP